MQLTSLSFSATWRLRDGQAFDFFLTVMDSSFFL